MEEDAADRASQEIKALTRRLDPRDSSHKDRIRRLNKFRNFVTGDGVRFSFFNKQTSKQKIASFVLCCFSCCCLCLCFFSFCFIVKIQKLC